MTTRNMQLLYKLIMILALAMVVSCGTNGSQNASTGDITAKLAWDDTSGKTTAKTVASAPAGVVTVRIIISAADMTTIQKDFSAASGSGTIDGVTPGTGRSLTAQGLDGAGAVIYQGAVSNLSVQAGQTTDAGTITMAAVGAPPTVTGMSPSSGAAGTVLTITGYNFSTTAANNTVKFNGTLATVASATATSLTVIVPSGATTGSISVTTAGGTGTSLGSFTVTTPTTGPVGTQMGGARQGSPLALTAVVTTLAGTPTNLDSIDGTGAAASFNVPNGVTTDGVYLYVSDSKSNKIRKVVIATGVVTTLAGSGTSGFLDGTGTSAQFSYPEGITTDGTNLYVADDLNSRIRKIVIATGVVTTLAGPVVGVATNGSPVSFVRPKSITTDGINVYVGDLDVVRKIVISNGVVSILAGGGLGPLITSGYAKDGTGKEALFKGIYGLTTDGTNVYVSDSGNERIRKIVIATGVVTTLAGGGGSGFNGSGSTDGTGLAAAFTSPFGITTDGTNLYVSDYGNDTIRKIVIATGVVTTLAGPGRVLASILDIDGTGTDATFFNPTGITSDGRNLYVMDDYLVHKIQ